MRLVSRLKQYSQDELDVLEGEIKDAPDRLQWAMNHCFARSASRYPDLRARAIAIGVRLEVLKDYPTPPNCTSPYAPANPARQPSRSAVG